MRRHPRWPDTAAMRELCASAPDRRTGTNARLEMADIGMVTCRRRRSGRRLLGKRRGEDL